MEGREQVNGFRARELEDRGVKEWRAKVEQEVRRDRGRWRVLDRVERAVDLVEIAPKERWPVDLTVSRAVDAPGTSRSTGCSQMLPATRTVTGASMGTSARRH